MGLLVVPGPDPEPWPSLGSEICALIEERAVYGPGSLQGLPYVIDPEFKAFIYRASEVYPKIVTKAFAGGGPALHVRDPHPWAGRRRFKRVGLSVRKGLAKTEKQALLAYVEIHPEGPTRFGGWDAHGNPVGRPVRSPYVPMLAVTLDQVEELAYGALKYIVEEGPDADLFDSSLERILRLDEYGRADGKAVPLANSPGGRDGARTTMNCFDEPHRLYLPRQLEAHTTMDANLPKRPLDDPWSLYVGTAGEPGQGSVAEQIHTEAMMISRGEIERADLFYLYRTDDDPEIDLTIKANRIIAVSQATGPAGEWAPGQYDEIASKWDRPGSDGAYLERVWLNRWTKAGSQAYDVKRWGELGQPGTIPKGARVAVGFDGARYRDSTALVITDVRTGRQEIWGLWERPLDVSDDDQWEVPEDEVTASLTRLMKVMDVWKVYADPPHWTETVGSWSGTWPDRVEEWWTNRKWPMAKAVRAYREAIASGAVTWSAGSPSSADLTKHIAAAGRRDIQLFDDDGQQLFILKKIHPERKFDAAMAATLSWQCYLDALKAGASAPRTKARVRRIR